MIGLVTSDSADEASPTALLGEHGSVGLPTSQKAVRAFCAVLTMGFAQRDNSTMCRGVVLAI